MKIEDLKINPFEKIGKEWALVTAGTEEKFNTMTVSWGGLGVLFGKNVATIYIRPSRYTYEFLKENDHFTISFLGEEYKDDLKILGSKSGRDIDKLSLTKLKSKVFAKDEIGFEEANLTLVCKKIYVDEMNYDNFPEDVKEKFFATGDVHYMIIGEIEEVK